MLSAVVPTLVAVAIPATPVTVSVPNKPLTLNLFDCAAPLYTLVVVAPVMVNAALVTDKAPLT